MRVSALVSAAIDFLSPSSWSAASAVCFLVPASSFLASVCAVFPAARLLSILSSFLPASASCFSAVAFSALSFSAAVLSFLICAFKSLSAPEASADSRASFSRRVFVRVSALVSAAIDFLSSSSCSVASAVCFLVPVSSFLASACAAFPAARLLSSLSSFLVPSPFSWVRRSCSACKRLNFPSAVLRFWVILRVSAFNNLLASVIFAFSPSRRRLVFFNLAADACPLAS